MSIHSVTNSILEKYQQVRRFSDEIVKPLAIEDYVVQATADASPPKWHLAHTTWFFETFILEKYQEGYTRINEDFNYLFNSYYETVGAFFPREMRGALSRPTVAEVQEYREYVDGHMTQLLQEDHIHKEKIEELTEIGLNHEQQHQELLITDVKYNFSVNPLKPVFHERKQKENLTKTETSYLLVKGGLVEVGFSGEAFAFDNESPRHKVWLDDFKLATHPVTNGEYLSFIEAGGYTTPDYWLSDGWATVKSEQWQAPLYWEKHEDGWYVFTTCGLEKVSPDEPVSHVSYYEAAAFASWAGKRLPTEEEWEHAVRDVVMAGHFADDRNFHPDESEHGEEGGFQKVYGDVWEWTKSPYTPYPGNRPLEGALGEYNAKFMCNQMVLRGGSCATMKNHIRPTYRNFFQPEKRWQFTGFRLAEDV